MFCTKCGNKLSDDAAFCTKCGASMKGDAQVNGVRSQTQQHPVPPINQAPPTPSTPPMNQMPQMNQASPINQTPPPMNQMPPQGQPGGFVPPGPGFQSYPQPVDQGLFMPPEPEKKGSKTVVIVLVVLTVVILTLCGGLLYFLLSSDDGDGRRGSSDDLDVSSSQSIRVDKTKTTSSSEKDKPITKTTAKPTEPLTTQPTTAKPTGYAGIEQLASQRKPVQINYVSSDVSAYPLVKVYFTAEDDMGNTVTLTSPTAGIKEVVSGGKEVEREVKSIEQLKGREGVSFDLVADKSGSMSYDLPQMQSIMTQFVDALDYKSGDKAELIAFDTYVMYMCTYTDDAQLLKNGINNMSAQGMTALYDALMESVNNAGAQQGARCVIAFTDGDDTDSIYSPDEVIRRANDLSVPIFIIGTNSSYNEYRMIAESTGGQYWNINNISDMHQIMDQIYAKEKDMYCIEYLSDSKEDSKKERLIQLAVADENYGGITEMQFTPTEARKQQAHTSRYEVIKGDVNWVEANAECIRRGGHLITITSDDEMKTASDLAESAGLSYVWIGGYTSVRSSTAYGHWITGEAFNYQKWYPGEPSRDDLDGTPEMYIMLWKVDSNGWTWNDQRDDLFTKELAKIFTNKTGYICEYES